MSRNVTIGMEMIGKEDWFLLSPFLILNPNLSNSLLVLFFLIGTFSESSEGVKWELGFASFCTGKWDFGRWDLDLSEKRAKMGMGLVFCYHISGIETLVSGIWKNMVAGKWDW